VITYRLSKRQLKELANGKTLQIAVPDTAAEDCEDLGLWAAERLPDVEREWIRATRRESIEITPPTGEQGDMAAALGHILREQDRWEGLVWFVEVVTVSICTRAKSRGTYPVQWPSTWEAPPAFPW
jgi:hypothetical protein